MTDEVRSIHPQASVHTIPLGIDLENYPFDAISTEDTQVVTMIGSFDWLPTRTSHYPAVGAIVARDFTSEFHSRPCGSSGGTHGRSSQITSASLG